MCPEWPSSIAVPPLAEALEVAEAIEVVEAVERAEAAEAPAAAAHVQHLSRSPTVARGTAPGGRPRGRARPPAPA